MTLLEEPTIEVLVDGRAPVAPRPCEHEVIGSSVVTADVHDWNGELLRREARLRLRCMNCGAPCEIETDGRAPADGAPGVVVTFCPQMNSEITNTPQEGPHAG